MPKSVIAQEEELLSFARLQLVYYAKCLVYCDITARIIESTSVDRSAKAVARLRTICEGFIQSVYASGMLSLPIKRLIEECLQTKELNLLPDLIEIDHAHHGILDRLEEILTLLEYTVNTCQHSKAVLGLQGCLAYFQHIQTKQETPLGWQMLIDSMYDTQNELRSVMKSIQTLP